MTEDFFTLVYSDTVCRILYKRKGRIISLGESKIAPGVINGGKVERPQVFAEIVKKLRKNVSGKPITTPFAIVALPEENLFMQIVSIPKVPENKILNVIKYQADKLVSFTLSDVYLDYHVVTEENNQLKVLLTACPKGVVDSLIGSLKLAGLTTLAVDSRSGALARIFAKTPHELVLIADYENGNARLVVAKNHVARLSTVSQLGSGSDALVAKIKETISFYSSRKETNKKIMRLILAGDINPNDYKTVGDKLNLPVTFASFHEIATTPNLRILHRYIANLGLYSSSNLGVNLLPESVKKSLRRDLVFREIAHIMDWLVVGTVVVGVSTFLFYNWLKFNNLTLSSSLSAERKVQISPNLLAIEERVVKLNEKLDILKKIKLKSDKKSLILENIRNSLPADSYLKQVTLNDQNVVSVEGTIPSRQLLLDYSKELEKNGYLVTIPLTNYESSANISFEITVRQKNE